MTIPLWVRLSFWAALFLGGAWLAWHIEGWREGAAKAEQLQTDLDSERALHKAADAARIRGAGNLEAQSDKVRVVIKEVIRRVPQLVRGDHACDFDGELTGVLNRARGYDLPAAGRPAAAAAGTAGAPP